MTNSFEQTPLVSVLIPSFNAERYINQCIDSVINQTYKNIEIIICDDASVDNTSKILNKYEAIDNRIKLTKNQNNLGYLRTFNKLLRMAEGDYITFLDSDDIMPSLRIEKQIQYLLSDSNIGLVGTNYGRITDNGKLYFKSDLPLKHDEIIQKIKQEGEFPFCGSSVMIKKEIVGTIGGYREYFDQCPGEDIDWIRRISEKYEVANIEYLGYLYRFSLTSLTRRPQFSIKARHIREIIKFLANQREANNGIDDLMGNGKALKEFEKKLMLPYIKDPSMLYRKVSIEYSIQKVWSLSLKFSLIAIKKCPLKVKNYFSFILIFPLLILPTPFLIRIKNFLGINHVSNKI